MQENIKPIQVKMTDRRYVRTEPIYQYDVGHTLDLSVFAAMLPETFQVHFGRSLMGDSITQIGQACSCQVPDMYAQTAAPIYAWLYIPETETGLTKYTIEIPVQRRARITNQEPTPVERSAIDQEIAALNAGVERAETAAEAAEAAQAGAEAAEQGASAAQQTAQAAARTATAQADRAKDEADRAEAAVEDVTEVAEQAAADLGGIVRDAQTQIAGSVQQAQQAAQAASGSATAAAGSAGAAAGSATAADQSAQAAAQTAAQFEEDITQLKSDIEDIAQEDTAQVISGLVAQITVLVRQIAEEGGSAGDLNGFSLSMGAGGEVVLSYVNPEDEEDTASAVMPTGTTQEEILSVMQDITGSLKIWAGGAA